MLIPARLRFYVLFCFCVVTLPFCVKGQQLGFYLEKERGKAVIPFELYNNLIVIQVILNDRYPLNFILDTGVRPTVLLDKAFADSIGMSYQRQIELSGVGSDKTVNALVTDGVSLAMRGVNSDNLSVLVLEENLLDLGKHLGIQVHGILGYDFFSRFVVRVNYSKQKMLLYNPSEFQKQKKSEAIDLDIIDSKPIACVKIHAEADRPLSVMLLVDTGASHALVLNPLSDEQIEIPGKHIEANLGRSISGEITGKLGRVAHVELGNRELSGVITSFIEESVEYTDLKRRNGSIGGELLKRFTITFDFYHKKMYLRPNSYLRHPFEYNMSGMELVATGTHLDRFVISRIRENSAASEAGFMAGDLVVSLDNISSEKLSLSKIYSNLNLREGKKINLTVLRKGSYISRTFYLKREI